MPSTSDFVSLRVLVRPNESRAAALKRALDECGIVFPAFIPTPGADWGYLVTSRAKIPLQDFKIGKDYIVKYE